MFKKSMMTLIAAGFLGSIAYAQSKPTNPSYPPTNNPGAAVNPGPQDLNNQPATKSVPPQKKRPLNTKGINQDGGPLGTTNGGSGTSTGTNTGGGTTTVGGNTGGANTVGGTGNGNGGVGPANTSGTTTR